MDGDILAPRSRPSPAGVKVRDVEYPALSMTVAPAAKSTSVEAESQPFSPARNKGHDTVVGETLTFKFDDPIHVSPEHVRPSSVSRIRPAFLRPRAADYSARNQGDLCRGADKFSTRRLPSAIG
jgi:hypothetical protein